VINLSFQALAFQGSFSYRKSVLLNGFCREKHTNAHLFSGESQDGVVVGDHA
jgi:hypothetical protein